MADELKYSVYSLIVRERAKQFACGFDDMHDDAHSKGELARMGAFFGMPGPIAHIEGGSFKPEFLLPDDMRGLPKLNRSTESNPGDIETRIRDLVKGAACFVAEIQRLQRKAGVNPEILED